MAHMALSRRPSVPPTAVAAAPVPTGGEKVLKSRWSDQSIPGPADSASEKRTRPKTTSSVRGGISESKRESAFNSTSPVINISPLNNSHSIDTGLADELDYITIDAPSDPTISVSHLRPDKASRILGIKHRRSMEPIPASARTSMVSTRSAREPPIAASFTPTLPLSSLYVVSGLPKSPHTWTLADPDAVIGLHHNEGAVNRWWRPEVLGSTISPGAGGGKKKKRGKTEEIMKGAGALSKQEVGKMLSKALKLSFTREVEVIASTLQPASTIHTFTFNLPAPNTPLAPTPSGDLLRASVLSTTDHRSSAATFNYPYADDPFARPSSAYLGPPSILGQGPHQASTSGVRGSTTNELNNPNNTITYHGVCLTVWSHADAERSSAIRRTLEAGRSRKESAQSLLASRVKNLRADISADGSDPTVQARRSARKNARGPWATDETDGETEGEGAVSESDFDVASTVGHGPGESTLFLPGDTVFWLPYALTLVSRHPVYDLMRDYLTLSWARFSKDVQSHTLQISKILAHPAPRAGDLIKLDASAKNDGGETSLEVIARFPGGLDFGRGLVDINFTMWPLFKCLNIDNILTICEIALAPTGRVLFFSRHPAMLGIAVMTIKYLVELRGWNGIALSAVHSRDAKIYIDDPGPWIMGLATEARYSIRPAPEVCVCDLDINYLSCPSPPPGVVSQKQQRERYRQRLLAAFESHYHPDHSVPSEFKEAFPAGRFRPVCKIQAKRGGSSAAVADSIKPPDWWHSTRIIQAFDAVLQDKYKKPSFFKRISMFGAVRRPPQLTAAEQLIQFSIRKRATAFVDARDDLETKIGRLSRRLNFLITESDLWRDKFVTFEQYAEKLSAEANQLRAKINKEQRETKRLSGLVTLTAVEKTKLQTQLRDTENAHKDAMSELEKMKETMEKMEMERAEMIAEVEAQIERALASMVVDIDIDEEDEEEEEEEDGTGSRGSRPHSRLSSVSGQVRSRRPSDANKRFLRSFGTESTLAESYGEGRDDTLVDRVDRDTGTIAEDDEEAAPSPKKKRFSATEDRPQDGMNAVDEGISQKTDKIAQKVFEIQQKLETALSSDRRRGHRKGLHSNQESEADLSENQAARARSAKVSRLVSKATKRRQRSGTASSAQSRSSTPAVHTDDGAMSPSTHTKSRLASSGTRSETPVHVRSASETSRGESTSHESASAGHDAPVIPEEEPVNPEEPTVRWVSSGASLSATTPQSPSDMAPATPAIAPGVSATTDDEETDFQSAYSASPRESYVEGQEQLDNEDDDIAPAFIENGRHDDLEHLTAANRSKVKRERVSSTATAVQHRDREQSQASPTFSEDTIVSSSGTHSKRILVEA